MVPSTDNAGVTHRFPPPLGLLWQEPRQRSLCFTPSFNDEDYDETTGVGHRNPVGRLREDLGDALINVRSTSWFIVGITDDPLSLNRGCQQAVPPLKHARSWSMAEGGRSPKQPMVAWKTVGDTASPSSTHPQLSPPAIQPAAKHCSAGLGNIMACVSSRPLLYPPGRGPDR